MHRQKQRGPRDELFVIHVAGVQAWRSAINAAKAFRRRHAHAAKERMQRNLDARRKFRHHTFAVQRNDLHLAIRKVFRQKAARGAKRVVSVRYGQIDLLDAHFQRVSGLGFVHVNRAIQKVAAGSFIGYFFVNIAQALLYLVRRHSGLFQSRGAIGDQRVKRHGVTRVYAEHRRRGRIVIAPGNGLGRGGKLEVLRRGRLGRGENREQKKQEVELAHVPPKDQRKMVAYRGGKGKEVR